MGSQQTLLDRRADNPQERKKILLESWKRRDGRSADRFRDTLIEWYGEEKGKAVQFAEPFEVCEYGHQPSKAELKRLFPFFESEPKTGD